MKEKMDVIIEYRNLDSIQKLISNINTRFLSNNMDLLGRQTIAEYSVSDSINWLNPQKLALLRFSPEQYYSKIKCPVLLVFGSLDKRIEAKENLKGIETIFATEGKRNYKSIILARVDHYYGVSIRSLGNGGIESVEDDDSNHKLYLQLNTWIKGIK